MTRRLVALAGLGMFATGLWWLSPTWCMIIVGAIILIDVALDLGLDLRG